MDRVLLLFEGGSSLLTYTITVAYYALIFGGVVTLISLILQWRFFVWVMASKRIDRGLFSGAGSVTKLEDLIGIDEAKASIMEIVDFLHAPDRYRGDGLRRAARRAAGRRAGVGKTTLARGDGRRSGRAVHRHGRGDARRSVLRHRRACASDRVFKQCRKLAAPSASTGPPSCFIDEIDALGTRNRGFTSVIGMSCRQHHAQPHPDRDGRHRLDVATSS